jgi:alanyl-tRNA synthetase
VKSYRVVADHLRASALLLHEGLTPSNEGRGYVLRRLIRRVWYHFNKLGSDTQKITARQDFSVVLEKLVRSLLLMYPETTASFASIVKGLLQEMEQFASTVSK